MRIRTIKSAVEDIKAADPKSAVTEYMVRKLCTNDEIPFIMSGKKYLVDIDVVKEYIASQCNGKGMI